MHFFRSVGIALITAVALSSCSNHDPVSSEVDRDKSPAAKLTISSTKAAGTCELPGCRPGFGNNRFRPANPPISPQPQQEPEPETEEEGQPSSPPATDAPLIVMTPAGTEHEMVFVPAGEFIMGSDRVSNERPVHTVSLDGFYIDKFEVTISQFNVFSMATGRTSVSRTGDHPVVQVSWFDAREYCQWTGLRLPTEAEWEKAARGTDGRTYPWGEEIDPTLANYNQTDLDGTAAVGSFPAGISPYGAHDMAGNVWEWVSDWYDRNYYSSSPKFNPIGPDDGTSRVYRGGAWSVGPSVLATMTRASFDPISGGSFIGFRCARPE